VPETVLINPHDHAARRRRGRRLGGLPVGAGPARRRAALARIRYAGLDPKGKPIEREAEGFHARVVQHECDHLIGRLYPTRMRDLTRFGYTSVPVPGHGSRPDD
jgi:peptide deformylase